MPEQKTWTCIGAAAVFAAVLGLVVAGAAHATDGGSAPPEEDPLALAAPEPPTYYETVVGQSSVAALSTTEAGTPTALAIDASEATASYRLLGEEAGRATWEVRIDGFRRRHERVDGLYDVVLVLPLPGLGDAKSEKGATEGAGFEPAQRGFLLEEGTPGRTVPLIYGGEPIELKRNIGLEKTLLAGLVRPDARDALPDLAGSGYRWTVWDAIVRWDPTHADVVQGTGFLRYTTPAGVAPPDAGDPRLAGYVITWLPGLPASIPPFAVRIDVAEAP